MVDRYQALVADEVKYHEVSGRDEIPPHQYKQVHKLYTGTIVLVPV
jgi:hypothetical protein